MFSQRNRGCNRGFSLVGSLAAIAIASVAMTAITTMLYSAQRETKSVAQKLEILQLQQVLISDLASSTMCGCNFDPTKNTGNPALNFDLSNPATASINMPNVYSSCVGGVPSNPTVIAGQLLPGTQGGLRVQDARLTNITATAPGSYRGDFIVNFEASAMVIARQPAKVVINFSADVTNPALAKITNCSSGATSGGGGGTSGTCAYVACAFTGPCTCPAGSKMLACVTAVADMGTGNGGTYIRGSGNVSFLNNPIDSNGICTTPWNQSYAMCCN